MHATKRQYQDIEYAMSWLECALDMERKKHEAVPVLPDIIRAWMAAQAWGYIIASYNLAEQALKVLLNFTIGFDSSNKHVRETHKLRPLFDHLRDYDKQVLRELYIEYWTLERGSKQGLSSFADIESFLDHLDDGTGSIGWRYVLTEESTNVPQMGDPHLAHLWEVIRGAISLLQYETHGHPVIKHGRLEHDRRHLDVYRYWLHNHVISGESWLNQDRILYLWGPDELNRSDYIIVHNGGCKLYYGTELTEIVKSSGLVVDDVRDEITAFIEARALGSTGSGP